MKALSFFLATLLHFSFLQAHEVVLLTGATQGVGLATAERLAKEGYVVYGTYRPSSDLEALKRACLHSQGRLLKIALDVRDESSITQAVETILQKEGKIDILINNAAAILYGAWETCTIEESQALFEVNYFGPMRLIQAVLPSMREHQKGHIINITDQQAYSPLPCFSVYAASKAALQNASESLFLSLKPWKIHVSCIESGFIDTSAEARCWNSTRFTANQNPYLSYFASIGLNWDKLRKQAQTPAAVSETILKALKSPSPLLRYQTSNQVKKVALLRGKDIQGVTFLKGQGAFVP